MPSSVSRRRPSTHPGFLLVEAVLGIAILALFLTAVYSALFHGLQATVAAGDRSRAAYVSNQALEAVTAIRDRDFGALDDPAVLTGNPHGVLLDPTTGQWQLS